MSNKNHNNKARSLLSWAGKLFIMVMVSLLVLFSLFLFWLAFYVYKDGYSGWSLLLLLAGIVFFLIGALSFRIALRMPRISYGLELKEDGIYQYFINFGRKETVERFVLYDDIEHIYIGPASIKIHNSPSFYIAVRVAWEWTENGKRAFASMYAEKQAQLEDLLNRFPQEIPVKATIYDLDNVPDHALPVIFASAELIEIKERNQLVLPFPSFRRQMTPGPQWEPPKTKDEREERYRKLDRYGTFFFKISLVYCFLYSLFCIPGWQMTGQQFDDWRMFLFPLPLMFPLILFFYLRIKMMVRQAIKQNLQIMAAYLLGGLGGTLIHQSGIIYFITIIEYGTYLLIALILTYFIVKLIWWFFYAFILLFDVLLKENFRAKRGTVPGSNKAFKQ